MLTKLQTVAIVTVVLVAGAGPAIASGGVHSSVQTSDSGFGTDSGTALSVATPGGNTTSGDNTTAGNTTSGDNTTAGNTTDGNVTDGNTTDGNTTDGNVTDGNTTDGNTTDGNVTDGNATRGPVDGLPAGVESFLDTTALTGQQTDPASLAGKMRAESEFAPNTSVELVRNSSSEYELAITVTGNATNVSFYLQQQAVEASQNISNVTAEVDGEPIAFGTTQARNSSWIGFEVDHFSTRNVSFNSTGANETDVNETDGNETDGNETDGDMDGNMTDGNMTDGNMTDGNVTDGNATRGPVDGLPAGVESFLNTTALTGQQTDPASLAGKMRAESEFAPNTSVELVRNTSSEYELAITVTGNATNVSFYLQQQAVEASQNITNVTAEVDGEPIAFGTTEANNTGWIAFEVDDFTTRNVSFSSAPPNGTDANETDENETEGDMDGNVTDGNETDGNATGGPVQGLPAGVESFLSTSPLTPRQVSPPSLAGKMRMESEFVSDTTIELVRNTSTNYTLAITVTGNATNVTFFLQQQAVQSSQNISNVTAEVDGEPIPFGTTEANNTGWIGFEVDHFSTRNVTFTSAGTNQTDGGTPDLPAEAAAFDKDGNGQIAITELGDAAAKYARGGLSITELGTVAAAYASG